MLCSVEKSVITDPLIQLTNFFCIIYCVTYAVAVMYIRNIPMAEKRIICFQSKQVNICIFISFLLLLYIFEDIF